MIIKNDSYGKTLQYLSGRCRNNVKPDFTDQEIMTIYIYIMRIEQHFRISEIYDFADQYQGQLLFLKSDSLWNRSLIGLLKEQIFR